jgi:hypothetical protein
MVQSGGIPDESRSGQRFCVVEVPNRAGVAAKDADEAGALFHDYGVAWAQGIGVTNGATLLKKGLSASRIGGLRILSKCLPPQARADEKENA